MFDHNVLLSSRRAMEADEVSIIDTGLVMSGAQTVVYFDGGVFSPYCRQLVTDQRSHIHDVVLLNIVSTYAIPVHCCI